MFDIEGYRLALRDRLQELLDEMLESQADKDYHALITKRTRTAAFKRR